MQEQRPDRLRDLKKKFLPLFYWLLAHAYSTPGLFIHRYVFQIALRQILQGRLRGNYFDNNNFFIDSVRYFEFDFFWKAITQTPLGRYLDLSSPRVLPLLLLARMPNAGAVLINPDGKDLDLTRKLIDSLGLIDNCQFIQVLINDLDLPEASFNTISSISVIEHIPDNGDSLAVKKLWQLLKPDGRMFLSVPCAAEATEEFIDFNEYGLLKPNANNFVFGQRFYNEKLLQKNIFSIAGNPIRSAVYGEKEPGMFIENREQKVSNPAYPYWREPYMMGKHFGYFTSIDDLPAWGVIAMEFLKS